MVVLVGLQKQGPRLRLSTSNKKMEIELFLKKQLVGKINRGLLDGLEENGTSYAYIGKRAFVFFAFLVEGGHLDDGTGRDRGFELAKGQKMANGKREL